MKAARVQSFQNTLMKESCKLWNEKISFRMCKNNISLSLTTREQFPPEFVCTYSLHNLPISVTVYSTQFFLQVAISVWFPLCKLVACWSNNYSGFFYHYLSNAWRTIIVPCASGRHPADSWHLLKNHVTFRPASKWITSSISHSWNKWTLFTNLSVTFRQY